jgi:hypothetical protein
MKPATYCRVAATIFALFAFAHAYRLIAPFEIHIGSHSVSDGASWVVLLVAAALSVLGFRTKG